MPHDWTQLTSVRLISYSMSEYWSYPITKRACGQGAQTYHCWWWEVAQESPKNCQSWRAACWSCWSLRSLHRGLKHKTQNRSRTLTWRRQAHHTDLEAQLTVMRFQSNLVLSPAFISNPISVELYYLLIADIVNSSMVFSTFQFLLYLKCPFITKLCWHKIKYSWVNASSIL